MSTAAGAFMSQLWMIGKPTIKILALAHVVAETVAVPQPCYGFSMFPTLDHSGDIVLMVPMAYWRPKIWGMTNKRPERGDLVVTTNVPNPS